MAWTAPRTWVTGETVTAALLNAHIRDNLLETSAATVTTAGDIAFADAANSMGSRLAIGSIGTFCVSTGSAPIWRAPAEDINYDDASTSQAGVSTSYLTGWGTDRTLPNVTVITGAAALIIVSCMYASNDTAGARTYISFSISGATTLAAGDAQGTQAASNAANDEVSLTTTRGAGITLTAGSNKFEMEARVSGGTGTIVRPRMLVIPF